MSALNAATRRWAPRDDLGPGGTARTLIFTATLVALVCAWTAGVSRIVDGSGATPLGLSLQLGGPIVLGVIAATIGIRWGHDRRAALDAGARDRYLLRTSVADLAHASDLIRAIVDTSPVATVAFDRDGNITFWSAAAERVFG
ncbi:MAG: PAS domain-containing protein, partial [Candidatus Dormibacteraeota bacterium]|nr:PAS domain-containing protein [Candidatus Dormibacteraeota bacterium]